MTRYVLILQTDVNVNVNGHNNWLDISQEILSDVVKIDCNARPLYNNEFMAVLEYVFGLQLGKLLIDKLQDTGASLSFEHIFVHEFCSRFVFSFSADSDEIGRSIGQDIVNEVKHVISFELSTE